MIAGGTVLGGRYLIEGERPSDHDELLSWWAVDRQLERRVVVVVMPGGSGSLDISRTARLDYAGRLLDGGEHEGEAYLVIRAERGAPAPGVGPHGPGPGPGPAPAAPTAAMGALGATAAMGAVPPTVHADATAAFDRPIEDATVVQPLPTLAAPAYGYPPPPPAGMPGTRPAISNSTLMRGAGLAAAAFVLGAGAVFAAGVLATPEPVVPTGPPSAEGVGPLVNDVPDRTLPSDPGPSPTVPLPVEVTTTTVPPTTKVERTTRPTKSTRPTTTRRRRGRSTPTVDDRVLP